MGYGGKGAQLLQVYLEVSHLQPTFPLGIAVMRFEVELPFSLLQMSLLMKELREGNTLPLLWSLRGNELVAEWESRGIRR